MTATPDHDLALADGCFAASYAEEHLTMHQYMYETSAADPASGGFLAAEGESGRNDDQDATRHIVPRVRVRIYP